MAGKTQMLHDLLYDTVKEISSSQEKWVSYLISTAWTYRHSLEEQLLIYAQKPNVKACTTLEDWNKNHNRWIKKGTKGIALPDNNRIKYVFDVSDTVSINNKPFRLWSLDSAMQRINHDYISVVTRIKNNFSEPDGDFLTDTIFNVIKGYVVDNSIDYITLLNSYKENSELEFLEDIEIRTVFNNLVHYSIYYQVCERFEINYESFDLDTFNNIKFFNTPDTILQVAQAISDITEELIPQFMREINSVIRERRNQNRTFDYNTEINENVHVDIIENERSIQNEQNHISSSGRLSNTEYQNSETTRVGQIRTDEIELSQNKPESTISSIESQERTERAFSEGSRASEPDARYDYQSESGTDERYDARQDNTTDGMGTNDEPHKIGSGGSRSTRDNIQLNFLDELGGTEENITTVPPFNIEELDIILRKEHMYINNIKKEDIVNYFQSHDNYDDRKNYLKENVFKGNFAAFRNIEKYDTTHIGYFLGEHENPEMNIVLYSGSYPTNPETKSEYEFDIIPKTIAKLIEKEEFLKSPFEKMTILQQHYYQGNINSEVERIIYSQVDAYLQSSSEIIETLYNLNTNKEKEDYIKSIIKDGVTTFNIDGVSLGYEKKDSCLVVFLGEYEHPKLTREYKWRNVLYDIEGLILSRYFDPSIQLPTEEEQRTAVFNSLEEFQQGNYFSQEEVDRILIRGSGVSKGKLRIYEMLSKNGKSKDDIKFLKKEYGQGGSSPSVGFISEDHSAKGITIYKGFYSQRYTYTLKWSYVRKRIKELIALDRYLNEKEKGEYTHYLSNKAYNSSVDKPLPTEKNTDTEDIMLYEYQFNKSDSVFIGIDEYEVVDVSNDIEINRLDFPLLFEKIKKEDLIEQVKDNPLNDHLLKPVQLNSNIISPELVPNKSPFEESTEILHINEIEVEQTNYRITDTNFQSGTPKVKYQNNIAAIRLLFLLEKENRNATSGEQEILGKYIGWGGLADVFDSTKSQWSNEYQELKTLLNEDEYTTARESTLTAFYTPPIVIKAMYQAIINSGFKYGNIIEPSCATGNFFGIIPEEISNSKLYGIELDSISGRIAKKLYPNANITVNGYENTNLPDSFFDVGIGNIPFGSFKVLDSRYDKLNFNIHDYFFAKTIDKVRPGGIIAFITSRYTMDKKNSTIRNYINERADFLGAIRLPNNSFQDSAGTKVVSDIIFLQKRERPIIQDQEWLHTELHEVGHAINSYFVTHPDMVLGNIGISNSMHGRETLDVIPFDDEPLETSLHKAIQNIKAEISVYLYDEVLEETQDIETIPADPTVRNYSYTNVDGDIYYRENSIMRKITVNATKEKRILGLLAIRDATRELIRVQTEDYSNSEVEKKQKVLNSIYDTFTSEYGLINSRANRLAFRDDDSYFLIQSLEIIKEDGTLERKADMFTKRTIRRYQPITSVDTAIEALPLSLSEKAKVDIEYICTLCNKSKEEVLHELKGIIYKVPNLDKEGNDEYVTADEYLSGNILEKLKIARLSSKIDDQYEYHVKALEKSLPKPLLPTEIYVRIGATWIPSSDYRDFMFELLDTSANYQEYIDISYSVITDKWNVKNKGFDNFNEIANRTYGTHRVNGYKLLEDCLNLKSTKIFDYDYDNDGKRIAVLNKKETVLAQQKQDAIKEKFKEWIWNSPERRKRLSKKYNETFNTIRPRNYEGSHLKFPAMNPEITFRSHQLDATARGLYGNNALLAHTVGAGKTFVMIAIAMELKRLGLFNNQWLIVPNHLVNQWRADFLKLYPAANILVATNKDFKMNNRKRFFGRIATSDYNAVIMGHSTFEKISMSPEYQKKHIQSEIDTITNGIRELKSSDYTGNSFTIKQMERTKKTLAVRLAKLNDVKRKDDIIYFEDFGVDRLYVDEAHNYKNLFLYTKMTNVAGLSQTEAQKSSDLFMKIRYLDEITGGKGAVFATGTPISNSMTEMYTMQRYLQYDTLKKMGLLNFDAWASTFGETVNAVELTPEGNGYRLKTRFAKFYNLPELITVFKEVADIKTSDMLDLPVPTAHFHSISVKPSEIQKELVDSLSKRADDIRNGLVEPHEDNMLKITNDGRKLALDQRLIDDTYPESENSKVNACIKNVLDIYTRTSDKKLTQLIFCDLSTPKPNTFNIYDEIRYKLILNGVSEHEIAYIHSAKTDTQKSDLFTNVRNGNVRVLIGSTQKMGAGTNVQNLLYAIHDLDCPWRPSDLEQRSGRIIRQGNTNKDVYIYRYVTEETFDAYLYQIVENKQKFISQIMTSKTPVRSAEDIDEASLSYAEIKALASGNPLIKEKMDLDIQVSKLKLEKASFLAEKYTLEDKVLIDYPKQIKTLKNQIENMKLDINDTVSSDEFEHMTILNICYTDKEKAGIALLLACQKLDGKFNTKKMIGNYKGFDMYLEPINSYDLLTKTKIVTLKKNEVYTLEISDSEHGNIIRINNAISNIPKDIVKKETKLAEYYKQIERSKSILSSSFSKEEELKQKSERLSELEKILDIGKDNVDLNIESPENKLKSSKKEKHYQR